MCYLILTKYNIIYHARVYTNLRLYRKYGHTDGGSAPNVAAVMEGKLKEKLESLGIGFLCLAQAALNPCTAYGSSNS